MNFLFLHTVVLSDLRTGRIAPPARARRSWRGKKVRFVVESVGRDDRIKRDATVSVASAILGVAPRCCCPEPGVGSQH